MAGFRTGRSSNLVPVVMILLVSTKNQDRWELSEGEAASMTAATLPMYRSHLLNLNARIWSQWNQDFLAPVYNFVQSIECSAMATANQKAWVFWTKLIRSKLNNGSEHVYRANAGPYLGFFVCGGKLHKPSQGSPVYRQGF